MKEVFLWKNRENDLSQVKRYHKFDVMFYRSNLLIHSKRVEAILSLLLHRALLIYPDINEKKSKLISKYHDDYELVLEGGDIPLQFKLMMNIGELSALKEREISAAKKLTSFYRNRKINGYNYKDLLMYAIEKNCREAQLHSFADKIDGYCEAVHEVLAGNVIFIEPVMNYHAKTFNNLQKNFPLIKELFEDEKTGDNLLNFPVVDLRGFFQNGRIGATPHTSESVERKTLIPHYEIWKKVTLEIFPNGLDLLTKQVEFHESQ